ncbi:hypothetical protein ACIRBY_31780 [Streptomyces sp. NPDC096136]|uniref:hypothetical protein n=1 Tax=Streptomyces sp. NPDC096136 TaxID=3366076 RepID=UPI00381F5538
MKTDQDQGAAVPVHWLQKSLAVAALTVAAPVVVWGFFLEIGVPFAVTGLVVAIPLLFLLTPQRFGNASLVVAFALLGWGVVGALVEMFLFWPSALLLMFAAFADPRRRPVTAKVIAGLGTLLTAAALAGCGAFAWHFYIGPALAEPHTYRAEVDAGWFRAGLGDAQDRLKPFGATQVRGSESDKGAYLQVRFPEGLSASEREGLKKEIAHLPGVREVELCPVLECG